MTYHIYKGKFISLQYKLPGGSRVKRLRMKHINIVNIFSSLEVITKKKISCNCPPF